ncbi:MAG: FlgD immunoglobulin-like domain containing protein, partial [Candidatus Eisenbacteria bacterium]
SLQADWMRVTPYTANGTFLSRIYDSGTVSTWGTMSWTADVPTGTSLAMAVRKGNTAVPDGSWSAWAPVASSGGAVGGIARYIQYSAALTANAGLDQTPALKDVGITCGACSAGAPTAIADLAATGTGNAGGGRANVRVHFSGVNAGDQVAVYRRGYGDYPLYRADHGGAPAAPASPAAAVAAGWTLTGVGASDALDVPPTRDFWYYVAFVNNACGVASAPSNRTAGTLDYILGDVSNGIAVCAGGGEAGDGVVSTPDMSALGAAYGSSFGPTDDRICLDVGPTTDFGVRSRPTPDGRLDFDDLVIYALGYQVPLPANAPPRASATAVAADHDEIALVAPTTVHSGEVFTVGVRLRGTGAVHAVSARLAWDANAAEFVDATGGALLNAAGGLLLVPSPGIIDAAVLGSAVSGFLGDGELAQVRFRATRDGDPRVRLSSSVARDAGNRTVNLGVASVPPPVVVYETGLGVVFPNPFQGNLNISFALARDTHASIVVYDVAGRAVRHLDEGTRPAGFHVVTWDGRGDGGNAAPAGIYIVRFDAGEVRQNRRVQLIR